MEFNTLPGAKALALLRRLRQDGDCDRCSAAADSSATLDRRTLACAALGLPLASAAHAQSSSQNPAPIPHDMSMFPSAWTKHEQIAMLIYPAFTALDLIGPQHYLAGLMGAKVHLVARTMTPVTSDTGVTILPTATFETCPKDLDILFAPGGTAGTIAAMNDAATLAFVADRGSRAKYVTSVCTGSLVLGAAGLLRGYRATSHWAVRDVLSEFDAVPVEERVVIDRNRITGAGVTSGLDFGLRITAELRDEQYARMQQLMSEYDPQPPFDAGSPRKAPKDAAMVKGMISGFQTAALAAARKAKT